MMFSFFAFAVVVFDLVYKSLDSFGVLLLLTFGLGALR
jgi:hypothetical protein